MIRCNTIIPPVHAPPATPTPPAQNLGGRDPQPPGLMPMSHVYFFFGGAQSIAKFDEGPWPIIVHWIRLCWDTSPPCAGTTPTLPETSTDGDTTTARTVDVTEIARSYYFDDIVSSYMGPSPV